MDSRYLVNSIIRPKAGFLSIVVLVLISANVAAAATETLASMPDTHAAGPAFSDTQAIHGRAIYDEKCAACHGHNLEGKGVPALAGSGFQKHWANGRQSLRDLYTFISRRMPPQAPGSLSGKDSLDVISMVLKANGYAPGKVALTVATLDMRLASANPSPQSGEIAELSSEGEEPTASTPILEALTDRPTDAELLNVSDTAWPMYNRDYRGQRFSSLRQINTENVGKLVPICVFQTGETGSFQASPLIYEGLLYITTATHTYAINAHTCHKVWDANNPSDPATPVMVTRGAALYRGKLFRSTPAGHLRALDAKTGKLLWDIQVTDAARGYWLGAAPVAADGLVFMGEAGADFGADAHLYAFEADSGRLKWTFDAIPRGKMEGANSWKGGAKHGGGSMWSTFTVDPAAGLIYASIGNPAPDFDGQIRPGANLFTDSVIALDLKTGSLAWYVQQVPHDTHDWDTAAAPTLFDQDGKSYMAVGNKEGYLYLYDGTRHQLISRSEVTEHSNVDAEITSSGVHVCPGWMGGVEWNGAAYSPSDKMLFINSVHLCGTYTRAATPFVEGAAYYGGDFDADPLTTAYGWTRGFDAATGTELWAYRSRTPMIAAVTATAGELLLTGDLNGDFIALGSKTGKELYRFNTGGAIAGGISVYSVDNDEHIAISSGNSSRSTWGTTGAATVFIFALPKS
jgi:PQQ-dependent dehydrogenase (methanol/ethanol family)